MVTSMLMFPSLAAGFGVASVVMVTSSVDVAGSPGIVCGGVDSFCGVLKKSQLFFAKVVANNVTRFAFYH